MKTRIAALIAASALALGALVAAPAFAIPETSVAFSLTYDGSPVDSGYSVVAYQSGSDRQAYFDSANGSYGGTGYDGEDSGLVPGTWTFKVYSDRDDDQTRLIYAFRKTVVAGENSLGAFNIPKLPKAAKEALHGTVRSVKGAPLKNVAVELYLTFPTVTVLEADAHAGGGTFDYAYDEVLSTILPGTKRPVIRPFLGMIEDGPEEGRSKFLEPVTGYKSFDYKAGSSKLNLVYRPRPFLKLNGAYRTSFTYNETYMPWASKRSTIKVTRKSGKISFSAYANVVKYGLKKAGGTMSLEIDGKTVKGYTKLNSKDQLTATIAGIAPGDHVLRVGYHAGTETRSAAYVFDLEVS